MVKYCAVDFCTSKNITSTSKDAEKISFFKVPKNQLQKWSESLKQELKPNQLICELHFNKTDLVDEDRVTLLDGTVFVSKHNRIRLKTGSVPQLHPNENLANNVLKIEDNSFVKIESDFMNVEDNTNSEFGVSDNPNPSDSLQLCINDLCNALKLNALPSNWSWMREPESILLSYLDFDLKLKCHLRIKSDLTVLLINAYTDECFDLGLKINDVEMLWEIFDYERNHLFCCGTGYQDQKCSQNCAGVVEKSILNKAPLNYRCLSCRRLRKNIQNKSYKKKTKCYEDLYRKTLYQLNLEKRRNRRLIQKEERLKNTLLLI